MYEGGQSLGSMEAGHMPLVPPISKPMFNNDLASIQFKKYIEPYCQPRVVKMC